MQSVAYVWQKNQVLTHLMTCTILLFFKISQDQSMNTTKKNTRKINATDVAEKAGVSKWTVSRAFTPGAYISSDSLKKVMDAAKELGYRPNLLARSLSKKKSGIIAVVVDEFTNPNALQVLDEVTRQLQKKGLNTLLLNIDTERSFESSLNLADQFQVDGVIFLGAVLPDQFVHLIQTIRHIPLIVLYRDCLLPDVHVFNTDDYQAGREVAQLFIEQGFTRLGYMAGPPIGSTHVDRLAGFSDEIKRHELTLDTLFEVGSYHRAKGLEALDNYLSNTDKTNFVEAIFCENDTLAIGALDALKIHNTKIAVVGFDDQDMASAPSYELTSYRQPFEKLAASAAQLLTKDETEMQRVILRGKLVKRSSHIKNAAQNTVE